ncbi:MAG: rhodanese-like domain-containing protein [Planctomycetota bacterium]
MAKRLLSESSGLAGSGGLVWERTLNRALWIAAIGGAAGVAHSVFQPITLERDEQAARDYGVAVFGGEEAIPAVSGNAGNDAAGIADITAANEPPAFDARAGSENQASADDAPVHATAPEPDCDGLWVFEEDISLEQGWCAWQAGTFVFFDARPYEEFEAGHVDGAFHVTGDMLSSGEPEALTVAFPEDPVIVYCVGGDCSDAKAVVIGLQQRGYTSLHIMTDGYPGWDALGYPTAAGPGMFLSGLEPDTDTDTDGGDDTDDTDGGDGGDGGGPGDPEDASREDPSGEGL